MSRTPFFIKLVRPTFGRWLLWRYRVERAGYDLLPRNGPFLILSNHAHFYDPFVISSSLAMHLRWVAGAYLFKNQVLSILLGRWIGGIAKQQGRSDLQSIRDISSALKAGDAVGLFPEGTRTWDGEPIEFSEATAKLVRLFGVPVVLINLEGAYALKPRWAVRARKGHMTIRVVRVLQPEQIKALSLNELFNLLRSTIGFSHSAWQEQKHLPFVSSHNAEGLEKLLYLCPSCEGRSTIRSHGSDISCTACDLVASLDAYDRLNFQSADPLNIRSIADWHRWEAARVASLAGSPLFPPDRGVLLQRGVEGKLLTLSKRFSLTLEEDSMVVKFPREVQSGMLKGLVSLVFDFSAVQSMIINAKSTVEFFHADQLWRIRITSDRSILKYVEWYLGKKQVSEDLGKENP